MHAASRRLFTAWLGLFLPTVAVAQTADAGPTEDAPQDEAVPALALNGTSEGSAKVDQGAEFAVTCEAAGVMSVVLRGQSADTDLSLYVTDEEGQTLPDGKADRDRGGHKGRERLLVDVPRAGTYYVIVDSKSEEPSAFVLGGAFIPVPDMAREPDPDGRPSAALALEVGAKSEDQVAPREGDVWDWYAVTPEQAGTLTVLTRAPAGGDLRLEAYADGAFRKWVEESDQDQNGTPGNETITMRVEAGVTYYFRVAPLVGVADAIEYSIASALIPD